MTQPLGEPADLYRLVGGLSVVQLLVDDLYERGLRDVFVRPYLVEAFANAHRAGRLKRHLVLLLCGLLDPAGEHGDWRSADLGAAHAHLNIPGEVYWALIGGHLGAGMSRFSVPPEVRKSLFAAAVDVESAIVARAVVAP